MALFVVLVDDCKLSRAFFKKTFAFMSSEQDFVKKPFDCGIKRVCKGLYALKITPLYPKVYWGSLLFIVPSFLIFGTPFKNALGSTLFFIGLGFLSLRFLWSKYFYYFMMYRGLRKTGYKGKIKLLEEREALRRFYDGTNRSI